ncbi:MAG: hypothetical protein RL150_533 [Candidatus Parcubacteria bacterium]|jgi:hypothetical protein
MSTSESTPSTVILSERPKWLDPYISGSDTIEFEGKTYRYDLVSPGFAQRNRTPHIFAIGTNGVLAVSKTIPKAFRSIVALHELMERDACDREDGCLETLMRELELLEPMGIDRKEYLPFREIFFAQVVSHYEGRANLATAAEKLHLARLRRSYEYLKELNAAAGKEATEKKE